MSNLLPSQKKKMRQKQRKAEARAKKVLPFIIVAVVRGFSLLISNIFHFTLGGRCEK